MLPARSCHTELTLLAADRKAFHFQILSNAHLRERARGRKKANKLVLSMGAENKTKQNKTEQKCLNAVRLSPLPVSNEMLEKLSHLKAFQRML